MQVDYSVAFCSSQSAKEAESRFKALGALDRHRKEIVRAIMAMCEFARLTYNTSYGGPEGADNSTLDNAVKARMLLSGDYAGQYLAVFRYAKQIIGSSDADVIGKIRATSDWLRAHGLNGIPDFITNGITTTMTINKTAEQMHRDMLAYVEYARDERRSNNQGDGAATTATAIPPRR